MSKRGYISRYFLILGKLRTNPYSSYEELKGHIENKLEIIQMQDDDLNIGFSNRTLQRDIRDIRNLWGVDIEYSKANKGYFISNSEAENMNFQRMMEAFDIFNSLNLAQDLTSFIHLENQRPQGTENLYGLLHAIKNKLQIKFSYKKFGEEVISERTVEPYVLKEFKNRWYVFANDLKDGIVKCFGLDRLTNLEITNRKFELTKTYNVEEAFRYCFGIFCPEDEEPQEIILSFNPGQGEYIKTLPIHSTQKILIDNENELKIKLKVYVTYDFIGQLLSLGDTMKVIKPDTLIKTIKTIQQNAFQQYEK